MFDSTDRIERTGCVSGAVQFPVSRSSQGRFDQRAFARPADSGDAGQGAERDPELYVVEVVVSCSVEFQPGASGRDGISRSGWRHSPVSGYWNRASLGEEFSGQRSGLGGQFLGRAFCDDASTVSSGGRSEVDQSIGGFEHFAVVFDDDQGVAEVSESSECTEQSVVVSGVQSDGGFIEDIEHTGQGPAHLSGQANPLALATRQRRKRAIQRQVFESKFDEEAESADGFAKQVAGDLFLVASEFHCSEHGQSLVEWQLTQRTDRVFGQRHSRHVRSQPVSLAFGTVDFTDQVEQSVAVGPRDPRRFVDGRV